MSKDFGKRLSRLLSTKKPQTDAGHVVHQLVVPTVIVLVALGLYAVGLKMLYVPALIAVSVWRLPMPRIFTSWLGKAFASLLLVAGILQIASSLQFLALPHSGFTVLAAITTGLFVAVWALAPDRPDEQVSIVSATDICGLIVAACFLLPFTPIFVGSHGVLKVADIATVQGSDGVKHYINIETMMADQHISYTRGRGQYYPSGFYVPVAFIQSTVFHSQPSLGWENDAFLYIGDYLLYGSMLGFVLYYLCAYWLRMFNKRLAPDGWSWSKLLLALCLAPPLAVFYLLPFVSEAFLSYYYVCLTLVGALLFLTELRHSVQTSEDSVDLAKDREGRWWLLGYLILMYGASMSWPLLIPPFLVIGALLLIPGRISWNTIRKRLVTVHTLPIVAAFALQLIPIYFQLKYSSTSTSKGINATGGLTQFHSYVIFLGAALVILALVTAKLEASYRRLLASIYLPLFAFLGVLVLYQYFTVGAVIYYVIKTSLLIEMLLLTFEVALLVAAFASSKIYEFRYAWALPVLPLLIMLLLIGSLYNPLKDDRNLFRSRSNNPVPQFYAQDAETYVKLGEANRLQHYDMTALHYISTRKEFSANMQGPYWAGALQYNASNQDKQAFGCTAGLYYILAFVKPSLYQQAQLQQKVRECVKEAASHGNKYYIVTDPASAVRVRNFVGSKATVVID